MHDCVANAPHLNLNKLVTDRRSLLQEKVADSSSKPPVHIAGRPSVPPYSLPALPIDDDEISSKGNSYWCSLNYFSWLSSLVLVFICCNVGLYVLHEVKAITCSYDVGLVLLICNKCFHIVDSNIILAINWHVYIHKKISMIHASWLYSTINTTLIQLWNQLSSIEMQFPMPLVSNILCRRIWSIHEVIFPSPQATHEFIKRFMADLEIIRERPAANEGY